MQGMISENISKLYKRISRAAIKAKRDPFEVNLIAVTKTVEIERIREAADAGLRLFGENRVQEAQDKIPAFASIALKEGFSKIEWHFIGHLQSNKARQAVRLFDMIHSVDSVELATQLNKEASKIGKVQPILIQVKLSEGETKHGVKEDELWVLIDHITQLRNLSLQGLMTLPPYFEAPEDTRPYFRRLVALRKTVQDRGIALPHLSMGMSHDCEVAIEEGATYIRVGTAIFGER